MGCTGNTATIAMTTPTWSFVGRTTEIGGLHEFIAVLDNSDLSDAEKRKYCAGQLVGRDPIPVTARVESGTDMPKLKEEGTVTVTFPAKVGSSAGTPPTLVGTGFVNDRVGPGFADEELLTCAFEVMLDGETGPDYFDEQA